MAKIYDVIGYLYHVDKNYINSLKYYHKALKIYKQNNIPNKISQAQLLISISRVYSDQENYENSLQDLENALEIYNEVYG